MSLDTQRIQHLTGNAGFSSSILIVGLGSGGFPVMQHLAMSGWRNFYLIDPDTLDEVNLVKHPARRSDIGKFKVDLAREWLLDRNPSCRVNTLTEDVTKLDPDDLSQLFDNASIVISATDSNSTRHFINDQCIASRTTEVIGLVHRGGLGGTVLIVRPGESGCYACMESVAEGLNLLPRDTDLPLTNDETEMIYGRNVTGYSAAGLSADIALVTAIHAQVAIAELLRSENAIGSLVAPSESEWLAVRMRADNSLSWQIHHLSLPQIDGCVSCGVEQR